MKLDKMTLEELIMANDICDEFIDELESNIDEYLVVLDNDESKRNAIIESESFVQTSKELKEIWAQRKKIRLRIKELIKGL